MCVHLYLKHFPFVFNNNPVFIATFHRMLDKDKMSSLQYILFKEICARHTGKKNRVKINHDI